MTRRLFWAALAAVLMSVGLIATDGPLTNLMNLKVRTDENGYLRVSGGTPGVTDGPLTAMANLKGRTDENGYLRVALTGGAFSSPLLGPDGSADAPAYSFSSDTNTGWYRRGSGQVSISIDGAVPAEFNNSGLASGLDLRDTSALKWGSGLGTHDLYLFRAAANAHAWKNGTNAQTGLLYGYESGARATYEERTCTTVAVTLSGATTATTNFVPAGSTVESVATSTTTTITGASGYTVGDGSDADRWGSVTGTAVGTVTGSTNYAADPRWWTNAARAITLTALTSNFTGGVVQVMACYRSATGT